MTIRSWQVAGTALLCCVFGSFAAPPTTTIDMTGVQGAVMGGVYTSPYLATVGGVSNTDVICDDFADNTYINETWTAYEINLGQLSQYSSYLTQYAPTINAPDGSSENYQMFSGSDPGLANFDSVYFCPTGTCSSTNPNDVLLNQSQAYAVEAYLAEDLLSIDQSTVAGQTLAGEVSFAMWGVFDYQALYPGSQYDDLTAAEQTAARNILASAGQYILANNLTASDYSNVTLYAWNGVTPAPSSACGGTCGAPQQLMSVTMAEPSSPALLAADMLAVFGLIAIFRKRIVRG